MSSRCDSTKHKGHLCVLVSEKKFDEVKRFVMDPRYICFNCGRVAHSTENLCNPMPLDSRNVATED